jgi:prepilin-type N-terminal cleavage/methylation domain-containing protein
MHTPTRQNRRGFTMIEILVVIFIIGILSVIAVAAFGRAQTRARDTLRVADVDTYHKALEMYFLDHRRYPTGVNLVLGEQATTLCADSGFASVCEGTKYHGLVSAAPMPLDGSCSVEENSYLYSSASGLDYTINFCLGRKTGSISAGPHYMTSRGVQ